MNQKHTILLFYQLVFIGCVQGNFVSVGFIVITVIVAFEA